MRSVFKSLFGGGGGTAFPYVVGEAYSTAWGSWTHHRGTSKDDGAAVSIFAFHATSTTDSRLGATRNGSKRLRTTRHPNVLSFLNGTEIEGANPQYPTGVTVYIVTEPVVPLAEKLKELQLSGAQRDEYISWGLHQVAAAVSFLNNDCKLVHGNVCLSAVVVTASLDWKLHGFDCVSEFPALAADAEGNPAPVSNEPFLASTIPYDFLIGSQYKPLEVTKADWATLRQSPPWAIDAWGLGCLFFELYNARLAKTEELRNTSSIPKTLLPEYQKLLSAAPTRRLNPAKLLDSSEFFRNKLLDTLSFLQNLSIKDGADKDLFFRKLPTQLDTIPPEIRKNKVLPLLLSGLEFGSAPAAALSSLMKIGTTLTPEANAAQIVPCIVKLFASTDRAVRVGLLQNLDSYAANMSATITDEQVFPHLASGFSDTSAFLRELTLKSMVLIAPKLSQRTLTQHVLKHLSKLQTDEEPAIRTNTTICIGNIARYLQDSARKRVLVNAFCRSLRDHFGPARAAGLMALIATSVYYDPTEIATRILPATVVLTIDADFDVREKAFKCTETFLQQLKEHYEQKASGAAEANATKSAPEGFLSWAVSSLSLVNRGKAGEGERTSGTDSPGHPSAEKVAATSPRIAAQGKTVPHQLQMASTVFGVQQFCCSKATDHGDGWEDYEPTTEAPPLPHPSTSGRVALSPSPAVQASMPPSRRTSDAADANNWEEPVKDDDVWEDMGMAAPPPAPRPPRDAELARAAHVQLGRPARGAARPALGRGTPKAGPMKLGAQRLSKPSTDL
eukprot:jgi/Chlat1/2269/Chrsp17S02575